MSTLLALLLPLWTAAPALPQTPLEGGARPLPAAAAAEARAAWEALLAAAFPADDPAPVTAFELEFEGRMYSADRQTNDFSGKYRYLEPGFVRTELARSERVTVRGPEGDWLIFKDGRKVKLEGRDFEVDVEELDRTVAVAQSFVALTDPRTIRIERLELLPGPPSSIPDALSKRAAALQWLLLETPDFRLANDRPPVAGVPPDLHHIELGLDRQTHLPSLVVVRQKALGQRGFESAQLLALQDFRPLDGYRVPHVVVTYGPDPSTSPWTFDARRPAVDLYVRGGTLRPRPALSPESFRP